MIEAALGGRSGVAGDALFAVHARIVALSDGRVHVTGLYYGGTQIDMGPSAALEIGDTSVVVTSHVAQMAYRNFYRMVGITPEAKKVLVTADRPGCSGMRMLASHTLCAYIMMNVEADCGSI